MADRSSEPDRRFDSEPPRGSVFTLGIRHWSPPGPHSARTGSLCRPRGDRSVWAAVLAFSVLLLASILRGGLASCGEERSQQQMADGAAAGVVVEHR